MRRLLAPALLLFPLAAFAAGSGSDSPPTPTETTTTCTDGMVFDADLGKCVEPEVESLNDDQRYRAVRELAYAGRLDDALRVLASMGDQQDDRVLTYYGYVHRARGDFELGDSYYLQAIDANPDNLLARSYMGQGLVIRGRVDEAYAQLTQIRARGGAGTWPEQALVQAILTGHDTSY
ncbi:tetratricopeptide repeat protein [Psychromarinibacter halotolerans]|uniref:Tetratricopeptide repeat protein n=1 Tax=Psychromarinibacter halotolerans TaxID=1775175 RepID=A0ABV7GSY3_9RHOB|nr:hypothetical protein [Psychromarinibacter halotolerans]MDF0597514.1 hypothetical protein [Psychromarinibacter halotolerans]